MFLWQMKSFSYLPKIVERIQSVEQDMHGHFKEQSFVSKVVNTRRLCFLRFHWRYHNNFIRFKCYNQQHIQTNSRTSGFLHHNISEIYQSLSGCKSALQFPCSARSTRTKKKCVYIPYLLFLLCKPLLNAFIPVPLET